MTEVLAIASREFLSNFRTASGAVVIALFLLLSGGFVAFAVLVPGAPAELRPLFSVSQWLALIVAPAISMRLFAEEYRSNTIEALLSTPVSEWAITAGKLMGAAGFFVVMLVPTLAYPLTLEALSGVEWSPVLTGYLGVLMLGLAYLSVGMFASSLTESQLVGFLGTFAFFVLLWVATGPGARLAPPPFDRVLYALSLGARLEDASRGVVNIADLVFFAALSVVAVTLTVVTLESRRWR